MVGHGSYPFPFNTANRVEHIDKPGQGVKGAIECPSEPCDVFKNLSHKLLLLKIPVSDERDQDIGAKDQLFHSTPRARF